MDKNTFLRFNFRLLPHALGGLVMLAPIVAWSLAPNPQTGSGSPAAGLSSYSTGRIDATEAIQGLVDLAAKSDGVVEIPNGDYVVNAEKGIQLRNGTKLILAPGARLIAKPTQKPNYAILAVYGVHDASVTGGSILGERSRHLGKGGEWGMCIDVKGSSSVRISNVIVSDCWGDGVYIGAWKGTPSTNITLDNISALRNRRQGLSITSADGVLVTNSKFNGTSGTPPASGIDLEPNKGENVSNVTIQNCEARDNQGSGVMTWNTASKVKIIGCSIQNNAISGIYLGGDVDTVEVSGNVIEGNKKKDFFVGDKVKNHKVGRNTYSSGP